MIKITTNEQLQIYTDSFTKESNIINIEDLINIFESGEDKSESNIKKLGQEVNDILLNLQRENLLDDNFQLNEKYIIDNNIKNNLITLYKEKKELYSKNKRNLRCIICNLTDDGSRNKSSTSLFTNKAIIDLDHISLQNQDINEVFNNVKSDKKTNLVFYSPSGDGLKILVNLDIPEGEIDNKELDDFYKWSYEIIRNYYTELLNTITDKTCDFNRACYIISNTRYYKSSNVESFQLWQDWLKLKKQKKTKSNFKEVKIQIGSKNHNHLITEFLKHLNANPQSIFSDYNDWIKLAFVIYHFFGSEGKNIFIELCKYDNNFNISSCNKQWQITENNFDINRVGKKPEKWLLKKLIDAGYIVKYNDNILKKSYWTEADYAVMMEELGYQIRISELGMRPFLISNNKMENLTEYMRNQILTDFRLKYNPSIKKNIIVDYMFSKDNIIFFNPLKEKFKEFDYIYSDEFDKMVSFIICEQPPELVRNLILRFMLGSFKNVLDNYYDEILILIGGQGIGKSWFITNCLLEPFKDYVCMDFQFDLSNADDRKKLAENMFIYDSENLSFKKRDIEIIKKVTSLQYLDYRTPYFSFSDRLKRISSFIMDTNNETIFNDETGGRRYNILSIKELKINKHNNDFLKSIDYNKVWSYVYNLYINGERPENIDVTGIETFRESARLKSDLEEIIDDLFEKSENYLTFDKIHEIITQELETTNNKNLLAGGFSRKKIGTYLNKYGKLDKKIDGKTVRVYLVQKRNERKPTQIELEIHDDMINNKENYINKILDDISKNGYIPTEEQKQTLKKLRKL